MIKHIEYSVSVIDKLNNGRHVVCCQNGEWSESEKSAQVEKS
jgi:hypothetical protein